MSTSSNDRPHCPHVGDLSIGRFVHYVSYGTPEGEYDKTCRAAVITEIAELKNEHGLVSLCVLNPTGLFFNSNVKYHDGSGNPGPPDCPYDHNDMPWRDCPIPGCGWTEPSYVGGTWHWPERTP